MTKGVSARSRRSSSSQPLPAFVARFALTTPIGSQSRLVAWRQILSIDSDVARVPADSRLGEPDARGPPQWVQTLRAMIPSRLEPCSRSYVPGPSDAASLARTCSRPAGERPAGAHCPRDKCVLSARPGAPRGRTLRARSPGH